MKAFTEPLKALGEFESIRDSLKKQKGMTEVQGCSMPRRLILSMDSARIFCSGSL